VPRIREIIPVSVDEITVLTILTLVITGTVAMVVVVDVTLEMAILVTVIADTMIGIRGDETEEIEVAEVAEVAEDVEEEMEIGHKVTIHAQFMGGTNGRNVSLTPMGIITGRGMATPMEIARVEETAQGEVTPTISIMNQMVAILMEVKGMAPTTTAILRTILTTVIVEVVATTLTIETTVTIIIWLILVCLIGIRND
jgi:hypothetical protein